MSANSSEVPAASSPAVPRTGVVVVTHDTRDEVLGCLATLGRAGADEIVVVDSGSRDGTAAAVRAAHPDVAVLELANVGFGRAANAGVRLTSAPTVVVSNADVRFDPGSVVALAEALERDPALGAVGPCVVYPDGAHQASARRDPDLATAIGHALVGRVAADNPWTRRYRQLDADPTRPRDVDWLSGCALALRREAVVELGGFDPGYFLYLEDVDLGARLRAAGWCVRYDPCARVVHRVGASTRANRMRALVQHAISLDRYHGRRHGSQLVGALVRPLLRVGLAAWVAVTWVAERLAAGRRSPTGERSRHR